MKEKVCRAGAGLVCWAAKALAASVLAGALFLGLAVAGPALAAWDLDWLAVLVFALAGWSLVAVGLVVLFGRSTLRPYEVGNGAG